MINKVVQLPVEERGHRVSSRRHRSAHGWSRRSRGLLATLVVIGLMALALGVFLGLRVFTLEEANEALRGSLYQREHELERLKPELERLRADVDALLKGRVPGLQPLVLDQVVNLDQAYLRNVVFTLVKRGSQVRYEYRLAMGNDTLQMVEPKVKINLFDRHGVHVGSARIGLGDKVEMELGPGEIVSRTGLIDLPEGEEEPVYFTVKAVVALPAAAG